ncbi:MAG: hypothetical protein AAF604_07900 [Acidobacteriota bacterium]
MTLTLCSLPVVAQEGPQDEDDIPFGITETMTVVNPMPPVPDYDGEPWYIDTTVESPDSSDHDSPGGGGEDPNGGGGGSDGGPDDNPCSDRVPRLENFRLASGSGAPQRLVWGESVVFDYILDGPFDGTGENAIGFIQQWVEYTRDRGALLSKLSVPGIEPDGRWTDQRASTLSSSGSAAERTVMNRTTYGGQPNFPTSGVQFRMTPYLRAKCLPTNEVFEIAGPEVRIETTFYDSLYYEIEPLQDCSVNRVEISDQDAWFGTPLAQWTKGCTSTVTFQSERQSEFTSEYESSNQFSATASATLSQFGELGAASEFLRREVFKVRTSQNLKSTTQYGAGSIVAIGARPRKRSVNLSIWRPHQGGWKLEARSFEQNFYDQVWEASLSCGTSPAFHLTPFNAGADCISLGGN